MPRGERVVHAPPAHTEFLVPARQPCDAQPPPAASPLPLLPQEILASKDADHSARWLAAVHLKNSCNKYWRSRLPGWVLGT